MVSGFTLFRVCMQTIRPTRQGHHHCFVPHGLQVYQALFALATRDFPRAAALFLDSIATFTTCELQLSTQRHSRSLAVTTRCLVLCALPLYVLKIVWLCST